MAVRLTDIVKNFVDTETSGDVSEWLDKLELVAKLQNVPCLETFVPLFLSGSAFAVYKQLSDEEKGQYELVKGRLIQAFGVNKFVAYEQLQRRVLQENESVDVYVADLRRLVSLVGQTEAEPLLKCAFVAGLPTSVSVQLKSVSVVESMNLQELISRARMIMSTATSSGPCAAGRPIAAKSSSSTVTCYACGGQGHIAKNCANEGRSGTLRPLTCYGCGAIGHIKKYCKKNVQDGGQGNEETRAL